MRHFSAALLIPIGCAALVAPAYAQFGRGNSDWSTAGFDAQRTAWVRTDPKISRDSLSKPGFAITWKIGLSKEAKAALGEPVLLNRYIGYRGFRSFAFVGGAGDNVYTVDTDLSRLEWKQHLAPGAAVPANCGGTGVPMLARPTVAAFPAAPQGRGGGGGGRSGPAKGAVGDAGEGAITIAAAARASAAMPAFGGRGGPGRGPDPNARRVQNSLFVLTADGMLHSVWLSSGDTNEDPIKFLPPGAAAQGFIVLDNVAYAATTAACGGTAGVSALDLASKEVANWKANGTVAGHSGAAVGPDGTLYVASAGSAPAVTALEAKTLQPKDWYESGAGDFTSSPVIFEYKDKALAAVAAKNGKILLLDTKSLGGSDHRTPLYAAAVDSAPESLATWQDGGGARYLLGATSNAVRAWKLAENDGNLALEPAWTSENIASPVTPIIVNGVAFSASKGGRSTPTVLYAMDAATGKPLWNSGKTIASSIENAGLSAGDTQVYVATADGTLYAFGFPIEH